MRILVVEDEADLASAVAAGLRREGYAVDVAPDGASALERIGTAPYDVVCLDLNLPDLDGLEVCRRVVLKLDGDQTGALVNDRFLVKVSSKTLDHDARKAILATVDLKGLGS